MLRTEADERQVKLAFVEYADRLALAMKLAHTDRAALADGIGVSVQAIGQVLKGETKALTALNNAKAARFLAVGAYWLATGEGEPREAAALRESLTDEAVIHAASWDRMTAAERRQLHFLMLASRKGVDPTKIKAAPRTLGGGMSGFGDLGEPEEPRQQGKAGKK